jgi:hypothetical protein
MLSNKKPYASKNVLSHRKMNGKELFPLAKSARKINIASIL